MNVVLTVASAEQVENSEWKVDVLFFATTVLFFMNNKDIDDSFIFLSPSDENKVIEDNDFLWHNCKQRGWMPVGLLKKGWFFSYSLLCLCISGLFRKILSVYICAQITLSKSWLLFIVYDKLEAK